MSTSFEAERHGVGGGWQPLVEELHKKLLELDPEYTVSQVKEKFGGLRYYIQFPETVSEENKKKMYDLIYEAESASFLICETCGKDGKPNNARWTKTLCEEHENERLERNKLLGGGLP